MRKVVLFNGDAHLGELQGKGAQVVGPGSYGPTKRPYLVLHDLPIATVSREQMLGAIGKYARVVDEARDKKPREARPRSNGCAEFPITLFVDVSGLQRRNDELQGPHPVHGSDGGHNFAVNTAKNSWFCFRCWSGGGALEWLAVREGLIPCHEAGKGRLDKKTLKKLVKIAKAKYGWRQPSNVVGYWDEEAGKYVTTRQ